MNTLTQSYDLQHIQYTFIELEFVHLTITRISGYWVDFAESALIIGYVSFYN